MTFYIWDILFLHLFDAFSYFDDMLLLRVDANKEFAPIKDFTGIYNPETALEKYKKLH